MIFDLFKRMARTPAFDAAGLGGTVLARPIASGCALPPATMGVAVDRAGHTRRVSAGGRIQLVEGESGWCVHPGPYGCDLVPFAQAPEIGLRLHFAIDSADPRLTQQRFDLYLASEASGELSLAAIAARVEDALRRELAQGNLELPPCTTLDEWNAFRAGFNQLLYTRFGLTVDDCVPVDLGASRDYAAALRERAQAAPAEPFGGAGAAAPVLAGTPAPATAARPADAPVEDARALRRLFLELPCIMCRLRLAALPNCPALFRQQQGLLQRLDLASLAAGTMPALALAAPGRPLAPDQQLRRARHSARATAALDEAWALLARLERAEDAGLEALFDEADRILANLEQALAGRKLAESGEEA